MEPDLLHPTVPSPQSAQRDRLAHVVAGSRGAGARGREGSLGPLRRPSHVHNLARMKPVEPSFCALVPALELGIDWGEHAKGGTYVINLRFNIIQDIIMLLRPCWRRVKKSRVVQALGGRHR
eukprot:4931650-Alexandrium_andersonii.AAC.1